MQLRTGGAVGGLAVDVTADVILPEDDGLSTVWSAGIVVAAGVVALVVAAGTVAVVVAAGTVAVVVAAGTVGVLVTAGTVGVLVTAGTVGVLVTAGTVGVLVTAGTVGVVVAAGVVAVAAAAGAVVVVAVVVVKRGVEVPTADDDVVEGSAEAASEKFEQTAPDNAHTSAVAAVKCFLTNIR